MGRPDYGNVHQQTRRRWAPIVATGRVTCWRCEELIPATGPWDLGHTDDGRSYRGPEHPACNRAAGARKTNTQRVNPRSRDW